MQCWDSLSHPLWACQLARSEHGDRDRGESLTRVADCEGHGWPQRSSASFVPGRAVPLGSLQADMGLVDTLVPEWSRDACLGAQQGDEGPQVLDGLQLCGPCVCSEL